MAQQWLSIVEYARAFSVSDMTVRRRIKTGKLQSVLRDGKYYIPVEVGVDGGYIKPSSARPKQVLKTTQQSEPAHSHDLDHDFELIHSQRPHAPTHVQKEVRVLEPTTAFENLTQSKPDAGIVEVCQKMLTKLHNTEALMSSKYQAQMQALLSDSKRKDGEIGQLKQQIEDLQVLVKILESNSN